MALASVVRSCFQLLYRSLLRFSEWCSRACAGEPCVVSDVGVCWHMQAHSECEVAWFRASLAKRGVQPCSALTYIMHAHAHVHAHVCTCTCACEFRVYSSKTTANRLSMCVAFVKGAIFLPSAVKWGNRFHAARWSVGSVVLTH